ncbi:2-C-methyl-D-erythritol 4-phosphate cytidylyltransferase [Blastococcus sp. CCUG 61487]|uniref:2-C-methyl-D-erythritol 4-phosphate cytidylyltransferase n=1 Tax=Blastococcus sp. CCUG 61487 TaxID=1840703 RepID=UPI0010C0B342|nr:2-C-methyl-D-erythritol 4-phosphate cytidylyltransferase [Blastococcus sp. CCUG 61487]
MHAVAIVAAAGSGSRLGAGLPKALVPLAGRPLVAWSVEALRAGGVAEIVVAVPAAQREAFAVALPGVRLVDGGASRTGSVRACLDAATAQADVVLVHDAARPLTPPELVRRVLSALGDGHPAVVPVLPVVDTTVTVDDAGVITDAPPRAALRRVQTPQGFARAVLSAAYADLPPDADLTDDATVVRAAGVPVLTVPGDERAAKVTVPHDLVLAEATVRTTGERASQGAPATEERNEPGVEPMSQVAR